MYLLITVLKNYTKSYKLITIRKRYFRFSKSTVTIPNIFYNNSPSLNSFSLYFIQNVYETHSSNICHFDFCFIHLYRYSANHNISRFYLVILSIIPISLCINNIKIECLVSIYKKIETKQYELQLRVKQLKLE